MSGSIPMDRFISGYGSHLQTFDDLAENLDFRDQESSTDYLIALQEMQMAGWAADIAVTRRHGLLKKVMDELR
jgi:hypothetical protein